LILNNAGGIADDGTDGAASFRNREYLALDVIIGVPLHAELLAILDDTEGQLLAVPHQAAREMVFWVEHPCVAVGAEEDEGAEFHHA
jgi:hypothetical protein